MPIRVLILSLAIGIGAAFAQEFVVTPSVINQGGTLRVKTSGEAESARMNGRTIRLFSQPEGEAEGLMPVPIPEPPGAYDIEFLDKNGAVLHTMPVTVHDAHFTSQNVILPRAIAQIKPSPGEMETVAAFRAIISDVRYWKDPLVAPVRGCMTSPFGVKRLRNGKPTGYHHEGIDQRAAQGTPVRAVAAGVVNISRQFNLHGGTVAIDHGQGLQSIYLHMSTTAASEGANVAAGQIIGYIGSTGRSTAPHLHWSLYVNGISVNPRQWISIRPCPLAKKPPRKHHAHVALKKTSTAAPKQN